MVIYYTADLSDKISIKLLQILLRKHKDRFLVLGNDSDQLMPGVLFACDFSVESCCHNESTFARVTEGGEVSKAKKNLEILEHLIPLRKDP